jgi:hypothetical protein
LDNELEFEPLLVDCKLILSRSELVVGDDGLSNSFDKEVFRFHTGDMFVWESIDRGFKDKFRARKDERKRRLSNQESGKVIYISLVKNKARLILDKKIGFYLSSSRILPGGIGFRHSIGELVKFL